MFASEEWSSHSCNSTISNPDIDSTTPTPVNASLPSHPPTPLHANKARLEVPLTPRLLWRCERYHTAIKHAVPPRVLVRSLHFLGILLRVRFSPLVIRWWTVRKPDLLPRPIEALCPGLVLLADYFLAILVGFALRFLVDYALAFEGKQTPIGVLRAV